jgi:hypothetical protein
MVLAVLGCVPGRRVGLRPKINEQREAHVNVRDNDEVRGRRKPRFARTYLGYGVSGPQLVDSGKDAPLSRSGQWIWRLVIVVLIVLVAVLIWLSR